MKTDESALTIITIAGRTIRYRLTKWETGSVLTVLDDEKAGEIRKASVIGYNAGTVVRKERVWTD